MELITQEDSFNSLFVNSNGITIESLFHIVEINEYLPKKSLDLYLEELKEYTLKYIMLSNDFTEEDNIDDIVKSNLAKIKNAINYYLRTMSPFAAINTLINMDKFGLIDYSLKMYETKKSSLYNRINVLNKKCEALKNNNFEIKNLFVDIYSCINEKYVSLIYTFMNKSLITDVTGLDELESVINALEIEVRILEYFNLSEVIAILVKMNKLGIYNNITEIALYNYIFNAFYKEITSLKISDEMYMILINDIKNGVINKDDVIDIIETGNIPFKEEEKGYIYNYFLPEFEKEFMEEKSYEKIIIN